MTECEALYMRGIFLLKLIHARMFVSIIANDSGATPIFVEKSKFRLFIDLLSFRSRYFLYYFSEFSCSFNSQHTGNLQNAIINWVQTQKSLKNGHPMKKGSIFRLKFRAKSHAELRMSTVETRKPGYLLCKLTQCICGEQ